MNLDRLPYQPAALIDFYEESLSAIGALCERTWHDRLEVLAEGSAASLWNTAGAMYAAELQFVSADSTAVRDAAREVFPGSPLTFRLAEALIPSPVPLERVVLADRTGHAPDIAILEKLWRAQFPDTHRWRSLQPLARDWHFSLLVLARCEIQAIDQHWSLHRIVISLADGELDEHLAGAVAFAEIESRPVSDIPWPVANPAEWGKLIQDSLARDLAGELAPIRARQENSLRRELERVSEYFENYSRELEERARRSASEGVKMKTADRLAAAKAEQSRRRADQLARHEIRVHPHLDALLLFAEPAWRATLQVERGRQPEELTARFIPRTRRWGLDRG